MAPVSIPIFREFSHPELSKVKLPNSKATIKELEELVKNTNALITRGLHAPGYRLTHGGDEDRKKAIGWVDTLQIKDGKVVAVSEFTPNGKTMIRNKDVRWVSSGIRRDFKLTGEPDGPVLPGLYLDHVAVLGSENPAVKGLVDLSRVELAEGASVRPGSEQFSVDEEAGEIAYFAEFDFKKENGMDPKEKDDSPTMAMFKELQGQVTNLNSSLTAEKARADKAEADLKALRASDEEAKFAEHQAEVKEEAAEVQKSLGLGAEFSEKLQAVGNAVFGTKNGMKLFKDLAATMKKSKIAPKGRVLANDDVEELNDDDLTSTAKFAEDGSDLTMQALNEAAYKPDIGKELTAILNFRRKKNPKFTMADLRSEVRARRR